MISACLADFASQLTSAAGGAVDVDFDGTVFVMVGLFILLWAVLKPLLFDPMLHLFEERERRIDGAKLLARKIDERSASALGEYESEMQKARATATAEQEKLRNEGLKREAEILAQVRTSTATTLEASRKELKDEVDKARKALEAEMGGLATEFASRALGREVRG
jgi:F-type H+-transporting ATPase subunit b